MLYPQGRDCIYVQTNEADAHTLIAQLEDIASREQSMPPLYQYRISMERLWAACRRGYRAKDVVSFLRDHAACPLPTEMQKFIVQTMNEWTPVSLVRTGVFIHVRGPSRMIQRLVSLPDLQRRMQGSSDSEITFLISDYGAIKLLLTREKIPFEDDGMVDAPNTLLKMSIQSGFGFRPYQRDAIEQFVQKDRSGVIVLPCGAGKTVVGVGILARLQLETLILVPNEAAAQQWRNHVLKCTDLSGDSVQIDDGKRPLAPVTITTYQKLTSRTRAGEHKHLMRYAAHGFGLVIYDEVHLLPAPLFRLAAEIHTRYRLGLSATLIREDGHAHDVYALVGPKCFEVHAQSLVEQGYLSQVRCVELSIPMNEEVASHYARSSVRSRHRIAADNEEKLPVIEALCNQHQDKKILIIGHYTDFLEKIADRLSCPILTGSTPKQERLRTYEQFRQGKLPILVLSRIANVAVDLPNADVAIQVSGLFGSRQEEAQRLGRILRPKTGGGIFYTLQSPGTVEEKTARHRQRFLVEQGFVYDRLSAVDFVNEG